MSFLAKLRYKAMRSPLRAPYAWYQHRGVTPNDVYLASVERSGNTWARFLLQEILGRGKAEFLTLNDTLPEMGTHVGKPPVLTNGGRLIKTHEPYRPEYKRAIYLVRDLRDVLDSNYSRDKEMGTAYYHGPDANLDDYLRDFLKGKVNRYGSWQDHVESWTNSPLARNGNLLVVRYEDMRKDTEGKLLEILNFLGIERPIEIVRAAIENNDLKNMRKKEEAAKASGTQIVKGKGQLIGGHSLSEQGRFVRSGSMGKWRDRLTPVQLALVDRYAGKTLQQMGYPLGTEVLAARKIAETETAPAGVNQ